MFTKRVAVRVVELSIGAFCTEYRCEQLSDIGVFWDQGNFVGPRGITIEMVTKRVAVRAVELSVGAFCTEFLCEHLCDDDIVLYWGRFLYFSRKGSL